MRAILACRAHRPYCFARLSAAAFVPTQPSHTGRRPQRRAATDWSPFLRGSAPRRPLRELAVRAMEVSLDPVTFPTIRLGKEAEGDMVVIGVYEEDFKVDGSDVEIGSEGLKELDGKYGGALSDVVLEKGFKGKRGSCGVVREGKEVRYVGMVGLGSKEKLSVESDWGKTVFEDVGGQVANHAKTLKVKKASVVFVEPLSGAVGVMGGKIALGVWLGGYEITRFKAEPKISPLEDLALVLGCEEEEFAPEIARAETVARGVILARSLVETPANICTPQYMADTAKMIADEFPDVMKLKVLEKEECEERKMGLYLAVARGSALPPKFIHLTYTPSDGQVDKKIALVGKGLSFDSGGYNIKMAMMELMKLDMGGASATLGAAKIIGALKPKGVEIHFIIAACENMIASDAYRPGDVITASNGKTVEIINTDAEGRLTLADALVYAQDECGAKTIVESSTLTGACMVGLGLNIAALYTDSETLAKSLKTASIQANEKLWRMPLEESYADALKSPVADLRNLGGKWGGSITAGLFLKEFVDPEKAEFAHLDVAGPVLVHDTGLATGYGAAMLAQWAENEAGSNEAA